MEWYQGRDRKVYLPGVYHRLLLRKTGRVETQIYDNSTYVKNYTYLGTVEAADGARIREDRAEE